ncbi:MAG: hypothetical protein L0K86_27300 [Actinomycetia bacterium]|nr:hypothetical protein [Actinomycetes bacterium]
MSIEDTLKERITQMSTDVQGGPSLQRSIEAGRARRRRRALAAVGSGVATACVIGVIAGAVFVRGGSGDGRESTLATAPEDVPQAIEQAVRERLPANAEITSTEVEAFPGGSSHINPPQLPPDKWDRAGSWLVEFELGSGEVIRVGLTNFAENDVPDAEVRSECAKARDCDYSELDDGTPVTARTEAMLPLDENKWTVGVSPAGVPDRDKVWTRRAVTVHLDGSYQVGVSDAVHEPTPDEAQSQWTLDPDEMRAIATDEDILGGASDG